MSRPLLVVVVSLALLAGCAPGPSRAPLVTAEPPSAGALRPPAARPAESPGPPGDRAHFLAAVDQAPLVAATRARLWAAQARVGSVGVLPDPVISAEGRRMREERTNGLEVWLQQDFPRWGERSSERDMARAEVLMAQAELDDARAMAAVEIAMSISRARAAHARAVLQDEEAARMRVLIEQVTAALAGGGDANAIDALALRSRIDAVELMAADLRRMALDAEDEAKVRLGVAPGNPLSDLTLPDLDEVILTDYAPERMAQARIAEAEAREGMARSRARPMVGLGVGWERDNLDMPDDGVMAMVEVSIPLYRDAYQAEARAARAGRTAAQRQVEAERLRASLLVRRAQRAQVQADQAQRVADDVTTRVDAEIAALRGQMAAGGAMGGRDILMRLFDRLDARSQARTAAIDARAEAEAMTAELWRFIPLTEIERR